VRVFGAAGAIAVAGAVVLAAAPALAHGSVPPGASPWSVWSLTPEMVLGTGLLAALYIAGLRRRRARAAPVEIWRGVAFFTGLAVVFLALQSPIDSTAERSFLMHQIQHLLIRMIGPMLILLSAPQGTLVAGTPDRLQRKLLAPIVANASVQGVIGFLTRPVIVTILFVGLLYFWQIPWLHAVALLSTPVHYFMHMTLLVSAFLFFWRLFDPRPAPAGARYGVRLMMIWIMVLSNILLGAYLAMKSTVLYPVYDVVGRLWFTALSDERLGAATIWIPGSMMGLAALLIVIHMWARHETREEQRRQAKLARHGHGWNAPPMTAAELIAEAAPKNRVMAFGLAAFVLTIFASTIMVGVINLILSGSPDG
jgi:putative membrane protein